MISKVISYKNVIYVEAFYLKKKKKGFLYKKYHNIQGEKEKEGGKRREKIP